MPLNSITSQSSIILGGQPLNTRHIVPLQVRSSTTQNAPLATFTDTSGNIAMQIDRNAEMTLTSSLGYSTQFTASGLWFTNTFSGNSYFVTQNTNGVLKHTGTTTIAGDTDIWNSSTSGFVINPSGGSSSRMLAANTHFIVKGSTSQTGDLTQWQNSAGSVLSKVDSSGNIGVGGTPKVRLQTSSSSTSPAPTLGTASGALYITNNDTAYGLLAGVTATGTAWLQVQRTDATATAYDLFLQPSGGNVGIGAAPSGSYIFDIQKTGSGTSTGARIYNSATAASSGARLDLQQGDVNTFIDSVSNTTGRVGTSTTHPLSIYTNNTERMHISGLGIIKYSAAIAEAATVIAGVGASGTINYDTMTNKNVLYYTSNASANWTFNVRGDSVTTLNTLMDTGQSLTVVFMNTNGTTAYYASAFQIDGTAVTPKWFGGSAPTAGNASSIDVYTYNIIKTGSATYTVLASLNKFA